MKLKKLSFFLILVAFAHSSIGQNCWNEVWSDDFNGTALNTNDWIYDTGAGFDGGWGNNEKEYYTNTTQNVSVSGGYLNLTARYQNNYIGSGKNFTSGKILTRDKHYWKYGRFEARIKLPGGTGVWPAFWMLSQNSPYGNWPTCGEIDIMEFRGDQTNKVDGTLHYGSASPNNQWDGNSYALSSGNFTSDFHLFAVEWEPNEIRWYVDGVLFKTETKTPNSLNPASNNAVTWPWDQDFFLILNLAVGGWYSGNPSEADIIGGNTSWTANVQIDYVKVYTDLSGGALTGTVTGKTSVLPSETNLTYSIPASTGATYAWTVTNGTISTGQGTNSITVNWGTASGSVNVTKTITCGSADYALPVTIMPVTCGTMLEDFENIRATYGLVNGQFAQKVVNPGSSAENTSPYSAQYVRNASEQYDVLILANPGIGDADLIENNTKRLMIDLYSNAAGRNVEITLENSNTSAANNYPTGRHSTYRATTTKANAWETLTFNWVASPEQNLVGTNVNQITILFMPNTNTGNTFYWDNLLIDETPAAGTMTGVTTVCNNQANVTFSIPAKSGVTYTWAVPTDATIISGQGSNSINVTFGIQGGNVSVTPAISSCVGTAVTKTITNNNCSTTGTSDATFSNLSMFPNPATDFVTLQLNNQYQSSSVKIQILENTGRIISEADYLTGNEIMLPVSSLQPGHYLIKISDGEYSSVKALFKK